MNSATQKQLKERWLTPKGKKVRQQVIDHIKEDDWERFLEGFLFVDEVENGRDLRCIYLNETNLYKANLRKANLHKANLRKANLHKADLHKAYLRKANLIGADLRRVDLMGANLIEADLMGADLIEADLIEAWLEGADLRGADLIGAELIEADLKGADLIEADLMGADLRGADLRGADLKGADLWEANLTGAWLREADLRVANLTGAWLRGADLREAKMNDAILVNSNFNQVDLSNADLSGASIYGISAWDIKTDKNTIMKNLIIGEDPLITVDDIEIAQFIYIILNNEKISNVITTMRTKGVLILGSFRKEEKKTLDFVKQIISNNKKGYVPIVFDFNPPKLQSLIDTIEVLSLLSRFIILDLTKSAGQLIELGLFDKLHIPYAIISSNKSEHIPGNIEKYIISEWCYKKEVVIYSEEKREDELDDLINNGIAVWAEEINRKYEKDIIGSREKLKEINDMLHKKNKDKR